MKGVILVEKDKRVLSWNTAAIPLYILCHPYLLGNKFYAVKYYFHVSQEVPGDTLFVAAVSGATGGGAGPGL